MSEEPLNLIQIAKLRKLDILESVALASAYEAVLEKIGSLINEKLALKAENEKLKQPLRDVETGKIVNPLSTVTMPVYALKQLMQENERLKNWAERMQHSLHGFSVLKKDLPYTTCGDMLAELEKILPKEK